jgi:hypothetical protein
VFSALSVVKKSFEANKKWKNSNPTGIGGVSIRQVAPIASRLGLGSVGFGI